MAKQLRAAVVQPPSLQQLADISNRLGLDIPEEDLPQYRESLKESSELYTRFCDLPEPSLPVKYPRTPGYRPPPDENPYNAWYYKTDIKGASAGKLQGKKVVIKDNIGVAGVPMMCGSKLLEGYVPEYDATVVTRILDAGGIIVGKGVCEDLCYTSSSSLSQTGPVLNPHDKTSSAGGSSSGVGVLVQTGEADMGMGGDQGGSIRMPASFVGIVGLKPTFGLVPYTGICSMSHSIDHTGPMTRTVKECALLLEVVAGDDSNVGLYGQSEVAAVPRYSEMLSKDLSGMTIGLVKEGFEVCEDDVAELVHKAAVDKLTAAGARVEDVSIPMHTNARSVVEVIQTPSHYMTMIKCSGYNVGQRGYQPASLADHFFKAGKGGGFRDMAYSLKRMCLFGEYMLENYGFQLTAKAQNMLPMVTHAYDDVLQTYDVIVMPTMVCKTRKLPPAEAGPTDIFEHTRGFNINTQPFNYTGHPSVSINAGFSEGLPVGMMITGKRFDDATVLKVAYAFEQMRDSE